MSRENILLEAESFTTVEESQVSEETKEKANTENGVYVKGMALPFGKTSRNGVQYEKESVKQTHEDLQGRAMLFNHKQDWVTGHILNTEVTDDGMYFEGDINPEAEMPNGVPVAQAIERGDINSVSIQAFIEQLGEEADEDAVVQSMETEKVAVKDFLEISAVSIPGFPQAEALPEHLQQQGVKPVTEMVGNSKVNKEDVTEESLENPEFEEGDFVSWEFGSGSSQGEVIDMTAEVGDSMSAGGNEFTIKEGDGPLYKMKEWDEEEEAFTNNVVKFEDELNDADRPDAAPDSASEQINKEAFEFRPVPDHVLYADEEDAMQRARNLGLEEIHEHQMGDQIYYMAGDNRDEWKQAIDKDDATEEDTRKEPFAGFDDWGDCIETMKDQGHDDESAKKICGALKARDEQLSTEQTFDDYPDAAVENARMALEAREDTGNPNDCGTRTGWERANQLDNRESLSEETVARMAQFERHEDNKDQGEEGRADCGWMMWKAWGGDEGIDWANRKMDQMEEEKREKLYNKIEDNDTMSNKDDTTESDEGQNQQEQVSGTNFEEFVASHMEGADVSDITDALSEYEFTGIDMREVAALIGQEVDEDTGTVLDALSELDGMEGEGTHGDMDDDEDEEDDDGMENTEKDKEELKEKIDDQEEKIEQLENQLETLIDNDEGTSQQESPTGEGEEVIERRPSFKGLTD